MTDLTLDDHLDALGAGLEQRRRLADRRRRRGFVGAGVVTIVLTVGLGAVVAIPGGRGLDPVEQARAAFGPAGELLHYEVLSQQEPVEGSTLPMPDPDAVGTAVWTTTTGAERYRLKSPADGRPSYCGAQTFVQPGARDLAVPTLVAPTEYAADEHTFSFYSPFSKAVVVRPRPRPEPTPAAGVVPGLPQIPGAGADPRDPVRAIRAALASGGLRDAGTVRGAHGRELRRLTGKLPLAEHETKPTELAYFVDAASFVPVELRSRRWSLWSRAGSRDHWKWVTNVDQFKRFERLPDTPENRRLLTIDAPPDTTVIRMDRRGRTTSPQQLSSRLGAAWPSGTAARAACRAVLRTAPTG